MEVMTSRTPVPQPFSTWAWLRTFETEDPVTTAAFVANVCPFYHQLFSTTLADKLSGMQTDINALKKDVAVMK